MNNTKTDEPLQKQIEILNKKQNSTTQTAYIELIKRKPTFDYILNDLAFESLKLKVIYGIASNQDKFDFDYQLKLKDKEIERLNNVINEYENMKKELLDYIYHNEYCRFGHIDGSDADEMRNILNRTDKLKELWESGNNE